MAHPSALSRLRSALLAALLAVSLAGAAQQAAQAAPTAYYVSLSGSDQNPGTQEAPFKTFSKAASMLQPGDTLYIAAGVYNQPLNITRSGLSGAPITVQPVPGAAVVIDLLNRSGNNLSLTGSYVKVKGLELRNSAGYCVNLQGTHNTVQSLRVHDCRDMGIFTDGQDESIIGNTVYRASTANRNFTMTSGWYSGIKVRLGGNRILIMGNWTYNNYGEGIAVTRASNVTVRRNVSHDNLSDNIYIDNSFGVLVDRNFVYNRGAGFGPGGIPCPNIAIGEEYYSGWGAQLSNITVTNNITYNGKHGVIFYGNASGAVGGGLKNSTIAYNTLWGSIKSELSVTYNAGQSGNLIANNIIQQPGGNLVRMTSAAGITFSHNFWVGSLPPPYARGPGDKAGDVRLASAPGFTAASFQLSSASPAINAGMLPSSVPTDYAGGSRPTGISTDMGAFEFGAAVP